MGDLARVSGPDGPVRARASVRTLGHGTAEARAERYRWLMAAGEDSAAVPAAGARPEAHFLAATIAWHEASYQGESARLGIPLDAVRIDATLSAGAPAGTGEAVSGRPCLCLQVVLESPAGLADIARLRAAVMARCPAIGLLRAGAEVTVRLEHVIPLGRRAA